MHFDSFTYDCSLLFAPKKSSFFRFFYKTCANTQQVLPVQTGLYRYYEQIVQEFTDENFNDIIEVNLVRYHKKLFTV